MGVPSTLAIPSGRSGPGLTKYVPEPYTPDIPSGLQKQQKAGLSEAEFQTKKAPAEESAAAECDTYAERSEIKAAQSYLQWPGQCNQ